MSNKKTVDFAANRPRLFPDMTIAEYYSKIQSTLFAVEENRYGRFIAIHTVFAEDDQEIFLGSPMTSPFTVIDATQEITIKNQSIVVKEVGNNQIELTFFSSNVIPHPM